MGAASASVHINTASRSAGFPQQESTGWGGGIVKARPSLDLLIFYFFF